MTVRDKLTEMMVNSGLWPKEADAVIKSLDDDENYKALVDVLNKPWEEYPHPFHGVAWATIRNLALKWIDANKPMHFARRSFVD